MTYFNETIETMPLGSLRQLQDERLKDRVRDVYACVPFYRRRLDEAGVDPRTFKGLEALASIPFTRKSDLRDHYPFELFARPRSEVIRIHCSSGTTGKPTVVGYTRADLDVFSEVVARSLVASGCRPGMLLQNAYGYSLFTGGLGIHDGAERLGMTVLPISGGGTERQLMLMEDFRADVLCCTPSYAQSLSEKLAARGRSPEEISLKLAVLGAEPWNEAIRSHVEAHMGVAATNIYGLSEIIGPGVSNEDIDERGTGSYVWEDHFFPEIVDKDTGEPLPYGQLGVLVFTTLTKEAMPLLRYWTGDITHLTYEHSNKRTHVKMGPIVGRADDMLIIRGVNFFPSQVEAALTGLSTINPAYEVVVRREGALDSVEIKLEVARDVMRSLGLTTLSIESVDQHPTLQALRGECVKRIRDITGLSMAVTLVACDTLPRSEGGKLSRLRDLRG